jgi:phosphonate transport system permease protein
MQETIKRTVFDSIIFTYAALLVMAAAFSADDEMTLAFIDSAWGYVFLLLALSAGLSLGLAKLNWKTLGNYIFQPEFKKAQDSEKKWYKQLWGVSLLVLFVVTVYAGINVTQVSIYELLNEAGRQGAADLFGAIFTPNFEILPKVILKVIETIYMAFLATVIAAPIAFVLSFFTAKNIMTHPAAFAVYMTLRTVLNVTRSVEPIVWATIFAVWAGFGPFAGALSLMIHSIASLAKQYSEIVESTSEGPIEGIKATGANTIQVIWYAIVPQVFLPFIAFTIYRWDINVRMATIIGMVGGGGVGSLYILYSNQSAWHEVGCIVLVIAAVVWLMDTASAFLREAIK